MFGEANINQPLKAVEKYVDYSNNHVKFLGAIIDQVQCGARQLDKVQALVAQNGASTLIRRDWLRVLNTEIKTVVSNFDVNTKAPPTTKMFSESKELISRNGKLCGHGVKADINEFFP